MSKVQPRKNCKLQKNNNLIIGVTRNFLQTRAKQYEGTQKQNKRIRVSFVKSQFFFRSQAAASQTSVTLILRLTFFFPFLRYVAK